MIEIQYKQESHLKPNQSWTPSVHGVILNEHNAILLHKREDHPLWAFPGGKLELGESVVDCLKREMYEETGLDVVPERLLGVFSSPEYLLTVKEMVFQPLLIVFLCRVIQGELTCNAESLSFLWLDQKNREKHETFPLVKEIARHVWQGEPAAFFDSTSFEKNLGLNQH